MTTKLTCTKDAMCASMLHVGGLVFCKRKTQLSVVCASARDAFLFVHGKNEAQHVKSNLYNVESCFIDMTETKN